MKVGIVPAANGRGSEDLEFEIDWERSEWRLCERNGIVNKHLDSSTLA
jgi:hypothetical protein